MAQWFSDERVKHLAGACAVLLGVAAIASAIAEDQGHRAAGDDASKPAKHAPAPTAPAAHKEVSADVPEPSGYRLDDYRSPVPVTLKGARVIEAEEARPLLRDNAAVFIDVYPRAPKPPNLPKNTVWRDPPHMSIQGAHWLPNVGYGVLAPHVASYFKTHLKRLTGGVKAKPVVFFCLKDCWMSWNAAKRAISWGYSSVIWFSEGTDGWQEAGEKLTRVKAVKGKGVQTGGKSGPSARAPAGQN